VGTEEQSLDRAAVLIRAGRYEEALHCLQPVITTPSPDWQGLYLAGQCRRYLNDIDGAVVMLSAAAAAAPSQCPVFLALGIALQLQGSFHDACLALGRAIEIDPNYALAYNSLGMTQKLSGELEKAAHNYDAGCLALARAITMRLQNQREAQILKHRDTRGALWEHYAMYGALHLVAEASGVDGIALPTGEQAIEEERTEANRGLYWVDVPDGDGGVSRLFLPNYFNTFRVSLTRDGTYSTLLGNRATVLNMMGRHDEARQHLDEATEFRPPSDVTGG
jgi:tetratricopeptide (TPR) repeat protein